MAIIFSWGSLRCIPNVICEIVMMRISSSLKSINHFHESPRLKTFISERVLLIASCRASPWTVWLFRAGTAPAIRIPSTCCLRNKQDDIVIVSGCCETIPVLCKVDAIFVTTMESNLEVAVLHGAIYALSRVIEETFVGKIGLLPVPCIIINELCLIKFN